MLDKKNSTYIINIYNKTTIKSQTNINQNQIFDSSNWPLFYLFLLKIFVIKYIVNNNF